MKSIFTLFFVAGVSIAAYSQTTLPRDPAGTMSAPNGRDLGTSRPIPANLPFSVITPPANNNTNSTPTDRTEQYYQELIASADALYNEQRYDEAIARYNQALERKKEHYPKDQILKANAGLARWKREQEQYEKDRVLRMKAETASGRFSEGHTIHFTGLVMSDQFSSKGISKIFVKDEYSDMLKPGKYDTILRYLPHASGTTLDGIAVPAGTRLIVYKELNCKGDVLLDITGPAIINDRRWENDERYMAANSKDYTPELQATYPQAVRTWSTNDMHFWITGSMEIRTVEVIGQ